MKASTDSQAVSPDFVAALFEAAVEDSGMEGLSALVARAVGVTTGTMWILDSGQISEISLTQDVLETLPSYVGYYSRLDPWQRGALKRMGRVYLGNEEISDTDLRKTEFFNDFARHTGVVRPMGGALTLAPGVALSVGVQETGTKRLFEPHDKPKLERLLPYIKRAMQLRLRVRSQASRDAAGAASIDSMGFGAVVCRPNGHVIFANLAAESLLKEQLGAVLRNRSSGLTAQRPEESRVLASLIRDAATSGPGGVLRLTAPDGSTGLLLLVTPLPLGTSAGLEGRYALVTMRRASDRPAFTEATLMSLFAMSPVQASIAIQVFCGLSPEEIAEKRGIRISTVRSHLTEVFVRTQTENQRELVRLLGTLPPLHRVQ